MKKLYFVFLMTIVSQICAYAQTATPFPVTFTDIAKQAGVSDTNVYGGVDSKKYIIETNGCGVAFFDYNNDGWTDVFVSNGTKLEGFPYLYTALFNEDSLKAGGVGKGVRTMKGTSYGWRK